MKLALSKFFTMKLTSSKFINFWMAASAGVVAAIQFYWQNPMLSMIFAAMALFYSW
ncbi:MAG: hypothetical protein HYZ21_00630 [Chloroflexi bacterium]|nr:hypothetical protein [Chloroflexota bacterium]